MAIQLTVAPTAFADASADDATIELAQLNAERVANGIPPVSLQPDWTCDSDAQGVSGGLWDTALDPATAPPFFIDPYWTSPMHLMDLINPQLAEVGFGPTCVVTSPGEDRPPPATPEILTYPGDGTTGIDASYAPTEYPFSPESVLGLPSPSGPPLFILPWGLGPGTLTDATLTGPNGAVPVATVDNTTPQVNVYLQPGGIILPVQPLQPQTTYTATATYTALSSGIAYPVAFTFTTVSPTYPNPPWSVQLTDDSGTLTASVATIINASELGHSYPIEVTLTAPDGTAVSLASEGAEGSGTYGWMTDNEVAAPGNYRFCASVGGVGTPYVSATQCAETDVMFTPKLSLDFSRNVLVAESTPAEAISIVVDRSDDGAPVARRTVASGQRWPLRLPAGSYRACASVPGSTLYKSVQVCRTATWAPDSIRLLEGNPIFVKRSPLAFHVGCHVVPDCIVTATLSVSGRAVATARVTIKPSTIGTLYFPLPETLVAALRAAGGRGLPASVRVAAHWVTGQTKHFTLRI